MPTIAPEGRLYVVVGVLRNQVGNLLIQQRLPGKPCEGQWEFPGGKLESHETPEQALIRELREELAIEVKQVCPLTQIGFDYPHANVWLDVYLITDFEGEATDREGQKMQWLPPDMIRKLDLLPAVYPILDALNPNG